MSSTVELSGGNFQDAQGNPLVNGYLLLRLSQDAVANSSDEIVAGYVVKITLDGSGNIVSGQYVWPNDVLSPSGTFYVVEARAANGQLVWGPNAQMIFSTPSPYNVGAWTPNDVSTATTQITNYNIGSFIPGQYSDNQVLMLIPVERTVFFATNFVPSVAAVGTNPTATATFTIKQNGTQFGTLTVSTSGVCTFSSTAATFNAGDVLTVIGQSSPDVTMANLGITFSGNTTVTVA